MKNKLEWDTKQEAALARAAGWSIDNDDWWVRAMRPADIEIGASDCHFGFTFERIAFVRSARFALSYDKRRIIPFAAGDAA